DGAGNLFIACGKYVVRMVNTAGIISTVAGDTIYGYTGDGGPATAAELEEPVGLTVAANNLYIVDYQSGTVRVVTNVAQAGIPAYNTQNSIIKIYPNPANNKIIIDETNVVEVKFFDVLGNEITTTKQNQIDVSNLPNGVYFIQVQTSTGISTQKIMVQH